MPVGLRPVRGALLCGLCQLSSRVVASPPGHSCGSARRRARRGGWPPRRWLAAAEDQPQAGTDTPRWGSPSL